MRINSTLYYVLKDHLGSASVVTDNTVNAAIVSEQRYYPYGETRLTATMLTDKLFTGQRDIGLGIYHYGARFYSPKLGRFLSADTIVPGYANPQAFNRYSYVLNMPVNATDPSGHKCVGEAGECTNSNGTPINGSGNSSGYTPPVSGNNGGGGGNGSGGGGGGEGAGGPPDYCSTYSGVCNNGIQTTTTTPNLWPDYWIISGIIPLGNPFFGIAVSITMDKYGNFYVAGGLGIGLPVTASGGGGWFLGPNNDNEAFAEGFLQGHSFTVSGGGSEYLLGPGVGVNNRLYRK